MWHYIKFCWTFRKKFPNFVYFIQANYYLNLWNRISNTKFYNNIFIHNSCNRKKKKHLFGNNEKKKKKENYLSLISPLDFNDIPIIENPFTYATVKVNGHEKSRVPTLQTGCSEIEECVYDELHASRSGSGGWGTISL